MSEHAQTEPVKSPAGRSLLDDLLQELTFFPEEAANAWLRLPHKWLFVLLFGAWIVLFQFFGNATIGYGRISSIFAWAWQMYGDREDDAFGKVIPLAVLVFFWIKRKELSTISARLWWPAIFYFAAAIFLHFIAFRVQQMRVSILAFILGLHALIGLVWGREAMRRTIFPVFLLLFCVPFGVLAEPFTFKLRILVTHVSVGIAHDIMAIDYVYREGTQIMGRNGRALYDVAPACSGIRSLVAMSALAVIYAFLNLNGPWRRIVLIVCAVPLALVSNIVRITTVIIVGDAFGQAWGAKIEQKFGFVTFAMSLFGVMGIAWLLSRKKPAAPAPAREVLEAETV